MKHRFSLDRYLPFLHSRNIKPTPGQLRKLDAYLKLLLDWSRRQNLFAAGDRPQLLERHFLPSFYFYERVRQHRPASLIDAGSGAGFTGIIIQTMMPELSVQCIDSSRKKCLFLQEVSETLKLSCRITNSRVEDVAVSAPVDLVVARFVADIPVLWQWTAPLIEPGGYLLVQKGEQFTTRLAGVKQIQVLRPDTAWIKTVPYLRDKFFIDLEKENVRKQRI